MLELGQIVGEIDCLTTQTRERAGVLADQVRLAISQSKMDEAEWARHVKRIQDAQTRWLTALPLGKEPQTIDSRTAAPPPPSEYTALATDGSQIPLDRHELAPCYVINVGEIALHYGKPERPRLTTRATLHYKEEDVFLDPDGEPSYVTDREIATRRMLWEARLLKELIEENRNRPNAVALIDGTLILWAQEAEPDARRKEVVAEFVQMLDCAKEARVPVAGYLSAPGSRDIVNSLRVTLCPDEQVRCRQQAGGKCHEACDSIKGVTDALLFRQLLSPGERTALYLSQSDVLQLYGEEQKIAFFYAHVGAEIARVEVPLWVAEEPALVGRVHALILDQAQKGNGYPVCLSEAHERAVVRAPEREAFFRLVARSFARQNVPMQVTRKAVAKRTRIL